MALVGCSEDPEPPPNPAVLHRLNRLEYDHTVRDLLHTELRPARAFPPDDPSLGFDNVADVLSLSPIAFELHYAAARALTDELIGRVSSVRFEGEALDGPDGVAFHSEAWRLTEGELHIPFAPTAVGAFRFEIAAYGEALAGPAELIVVDGDDSLQTITLSDRPGRFEVPLTVNSTTAPPRLALRLAAPRVEGRSARAAFVDWVRIDGPLESTKPGPGYDAVFTCTPDASVGPCLEQILRGFLRRAYRRTPTAAEVERWTALSSASFAAGDRFDEAVVRSLVGILSTLR